jgi:hypothetical protein
VGLATGPTPSGIPHSVRTEPVEALSFFLLLRWRREGQGFDRLSPNGVGVRIPHLSIQIVALAVPALMLRASTKRSRP